MSIHGSKSAWFALRGKTRQERMLASAPKWEFKPMENEKCVLCCERAEVYGPLESPLCCGCAMTISYDDDREITLGEATGKLKRLARKCESGKKWLKMMRRSKQ